MHVGRNARLILGTLIIGLVATAIAVTTAAVAAPEQQKKFKVALLFIGQTNDRSWGQGWADGVKAAAKKYPIEIALSENLVTPDQVLSSGSSFGAKKYDLVIIGYGAVADVTAKLGRQFPNTTWIQCAFQFRTRAEQVAKTPRNVGHCDIEQQETAFFAGALAGMVTKTNKVAAISGFAFPAVTRQVEAFELGARCVNRKVKSLQKYINTFDDPALANASVKGLAGDGADVILGVLDAATQGMYQPAREAPQKTWIIPSYFDDYKAAPEVVLTSALYGLPQVAQDLVRRFIQGKIGARFFHSYSAKNFAAAAQLAPFHGNRSKIPTAAIKKVGQLRALYKQGKLRIPDETVGSPLIGKPGSAAKINVRTLGCKPVR